MATIALYASKINNMPRLIQDVKKFVTDYQFELSALKKKSLQINKSVCNLDDVLSSISTSTQTQEQEITSLENLSNNIKQFTSDVNRIDMDVADVINQRKDDFYNEYNYLKPDSEKNGWEKFCDACKAVGEWCKEHWKIVVTAVLLAGAIAIIVLSGGTSLGPLTPLLLMVTKGVIFGAITGALAGGTISVFTGGTFFEGFENGAFSGAISGAITGGMGSWLRLGGQAGLSLGKVMLIGATAETGASLLGDFGDIAIKGEKISSGEVMFNAGFSFVLGGVFGLGGYILPKIRIPGINKGNGNWAHVWATQSTRFLKQGTSVKLKTILKGIGSQIVDDMWDYCLEPLKNGIDKWKESWNLIPQH